MPISAAVRAMRMAISPRLAIRSFFMSCPEYLLIERNAQSGLSARGIRLSAQSHGPGPARGGLEGQCASHRCTARKMRGARHGRQFCAFDEYVAGFRCAQQMGIERAILRGEPYIVP